MDSITKNRDIYVKNVVVTILEDEMAIQNISAYASLYGYTDADSYLKAMYGNGASESSYRKYLEDGGFDVTYVEGPGNHNWDFWDEYIQYVLEWMFK